MIFTLNELNLRRHRIREDVQKLMSADIKGVQSIYGHQTKQLKPLKLEKCYQGLKNACIILQEITLFYKMFFK